MNNSVICCVFDYNDHEAASRWADRLSEHFDTLILDSGSTPPCPHEKAVHYGNIYYSGLINKAYGMMLERDCRWLMVVTSDIEIDDRNFNRLVSVMKDMVNTVNVGLYQPCCRWSPRGRALPQSLCHFSGKLRCVNFQEGWFHLMSRDVAESILPVNQEINRFGWGIDLALCHSARQLGKLILVDDRVKVLHPRGTGYNREEALEQMRAWHETIPGYTSPRHFKPLSEDLKYRR